MVNEIMWHKKYNVDVKVMAIKQNNNGKAYALIFVDSIANNQNGNGWVWVKLNSLIPYPAAERYKPDGMSKTKKNKIKSMLTLSYAEWMCTDGNVFTDIEEAIKHQEKLMEKN